MIVYDVEIKKAIPNKNEEKIPGIEYCNGWNDLTGMGISCICAYDYKTDRYNVFCEDNFGAFQDLLNQESTDILTGFNIQNFDNKLIEAHGIHIPETVLIRDLLQDLWKQCGRVKGLGLDPMCKANGIEGKNGKGALAPVAWQQGKIGEVIDYCLHDVWMTAALIDKAGLNGCLVNPNGGIINLPAWKGMGA